MAPQKDLSVCSKTHIVSLYKKWKKFMGVIMVQRRWRKFMTHAERKQSEQFSRIAVLDIRIKLLGKTLGC